MNKLKRLLTDTIGFAIGNVLSKVILFFLMPIYTSYMTTVQYGTAELVNNVVELLFPIMTLCISDGVFRFAIDYDTDKKELMGIGVNIIFKGACIGGILAFLCSFFIPMQYTWFCYFVYLSTACKTFLSYFSRGLSYNKKFIFSGVLNTVLLCIFNILFLVIIQINIYGYLLSIILANFITALYLFLSCKLNRFFNWHIKDKGLQSSLLLYCLPNIPNNIAWWFNNVSSRYIISAILGLSAGGMFAAASKLPSLVNLLATIFQQAWNYNSSLEYGKKNYKAYYRNVFFLYFLFIFAVTPLIILLMPFIADILLKGEFYTAWKYVPLMIVSAVIGCFSTFFGSFYTAVKKTKMVMVSTVIGCIVNLCITLAFTKLLGIYGAVLGNLIGYFIITLIRYADTYKYSGIDFPIIRFIFVVALLIAESILLVYDMQLALIPCFIVYVYLFFLLLRNKKRRISK